MSQMLTVDPRGLHLPPSRIDGADPQKLARQIARYGTSAAGMPPLVVSRGRDGKLMVIDGVTRATRIAKYLPGTTVDVEVISDLAGNCGQFPTVNERLP